MYPSVFVLCIALVFSKVCTKNSMQTNVHNIFFIFFVLLILPEQSGFVP